MSTAGSAKTGDDERPKFTPSVMVLQRRGLLGEGSASRPTPTTNTTNDGNGGTKPTDAKARHGVSAAYRGDPSVKANQSADIDESENTALFLQNLPPECPYPLLLAAIRGVGKVQATHITAPGDGHSTSCAKLAFYTRAAAEKLFAKIRAGEVIVGGYRTRCVWNRVKVAGQGDRNHSRIVLIVGPEELASRERIDALFGANLVYDTDEVIDYGVKDGLARLEYRFGSYTCQAQFAMKAIRAHFDEEAVYAEYGRFDPCEFSV